MNDYSSKKKHKGKANGFLAFMLEYQRQNQVDINEAQLKCGELWPKMVPNQRAKYSDKASSVSSQRSLFTSFGVSFDEIDRKKSDEIQRQKQMEMMIDEMLQSAVAQKRLMTSTFYLFNASHFVITLTGEIFPAELAMSKFSLEKGVYDSFNILVNPGKLPLGRAADALIHAENTHKRVLPTEKDVVSDYDSILSKMFAFMEVNDNDRSSFPPLFITQGQKNEEFKTGRMTLDKIATEAGRKNFCFRLYPAEYLLLKLQQKCIAAGKHSNNPLNTILRAKELLDRDSYEFCHELGCAFHQEQESSQHCCLSKVKRTGFNIIQNCLNHSSNVKIPGRHFPEESKDNLEDEVVSTVCKDSEWDTISESMRTFKIDTHDSVSRTSKTVYQTEPSYAESLKASEAAGGNDETASISKVPFKASSFTQLIRRGGKR